MEEGRKGRTFCVGGGTGRPRRPIGEGLTVPKGMLPLPIILGRARGVGSRIKRVERLERGATYDEGKLEEMGNQMSFSQVGCERCEVTEGGLPSSWMGKEGENVVSWIL
ncbi:unnamed protein product [Merluccius merluccius]